MKIKITEANDFNCFTKEDLNCEKTVYAVFKKNNDYYYLIDNGMPLFVKGNKNILIIDNYIPKEWIYTKKFLDDYTNPNEGIICLKDLYCPQWMLDDKNFFFEVFLDRKQAQQKFLNKI